MIRIKYLANAVTVLRIVLSITLLFLVRQPFAFVVVYLCCGISDAADGFIARRLDIETAIGAKLDSLADFIFFAVSLFVLSTSVHLVNLVLSLIIVVVIALIRFVNLIVTRQKFNQWSIMHTLANKATGLALFLGIPICVWMKNIPLGLMLSVGIIAALSAIEELLILLTSKAYNANRKSLFCKTGHL